MAISTDATIWFFGTQDEVTSGTASTVSSAAFSDTDDTAEWTNDDDAPWASATLKYQFDTTFPTVGSIGLYAKLNNVQSTNDELDDSDGYHFLGAFKIPYGATADTDYYATIPLFEVPQAGASQAILFKIKNEGTAQTIGTGWQLWITPKTYGPHA
jgi:hypothetical protein